MKTDVCVIGGGPAGSTAALRLAALGIGTTIVEREPFPRYHIGESMTGECGAIVRELGLGDRMTAAGHPIKHGVRVWGTQGNHGWWAPVMRRAPDNRLHEQVTWQGRRSEFDAMMLNEAVARGAVLVPGRAVSARLGADGRTVRGARVQLGDGALLDIEAEMTLDCSGQATFLAHQGVTGPKYQGAYDKQIAVFTQLEGYARDDGSDPMLQPGNTHIYYQSKYHWAWAIPLDDRITSVGIVVPAQTFCARRETPHDFIVRELRELNPALAARVERPRLVEPAHVVPNYSFQVRGFAGRGYICVGDSHRFVDPIFSFGMYVAMREAGYAAQATAAWLAGVGRDDADPFRSHMIHCEKGLDVIEEMIDLFWEHPFAFATFLHRRYRGPIIDIFAGRGYDELPRGDVQGVVEVFRRMLGRERRYDADGMYSVPIGSRYHPERAALWSSAGDCVPPTEAWMRTMGGPAPEHDA